MLYVLALVAVVVGVDVLFFKRHFWPRPMVNGGIVLVFAAFYLRFQAHSAVSKRLLAVRLSVRRPFGLRHFRSHHLRMVRDRG